MARNQIAKVTWDEPNVALTFTFTGGNAVTIGKQDIPEGLHESFFMHGLEQKLRDSYAGSKTVDEAIAAFTATADTVRGGDWGKRREGSGPAQPAIVVEVVMLMAETRGKPFADTTAARAWIDRMKEKNLLAAVKSTPEYVAAENAVRTRRAAATAPKIDLDAEL